MKDGKALKDYLRIHDITVEAFIGKVSISRATLYKWFDTEKFDSVIRGKIFKDGEIPKEVFQNKIDSEHNQSPNNMPQQKEIEMLREMLKAKDEVIKSKDETIEALKSGGDRTQLKSKAS